MKPRSFALPAATALATLLAMGHLPAQAIGHLADVTIVDRDTGATLPVHYAKGEYWVAGRPGARYAVTVHNRIGERVLAVPSVDGVNVLSGETAAWGQTGYVFSPHERYQITGWRKSNSEVAAFEFSSVANSYASRTGRPAHVGVIGVALFRERQPLPSPSVAPEPYRQRRELRENADRLSDAPAPALPAPAPASPAATAPAPASEAESSIAAQAAGNVAKSAPAAAARLGTAHGQRETSVVSHTSFTRLQERPNEVITIRYDSRDNLVSAGVIREQPNRQPTPRAFPQSDNPSYVPDPS